MKIKDGFVLREVAGKQMVLPVGKRTQEVHGMIALNETGCFLWKKLSEGCSEQELIESMLDEYEVDLEVITKDVNQFIKLLTEKKLLGEIDE